MGAKIEDLERATAQIFRRNGSLAGHGLLARLGQKTLILTCHHVVAAANPEAGVVQVELLTEAGPVNYSASYVEDLSAPEEDVAVLRIEIDVLPPEIPLYLLPDDHNHLTPVYIVFPGLRPTSADATLTRRTPLKVKEQSTQYEIPVAFKLSNSSDARPGTSGGLVIAEHGVVGLCHFARSEKGEVARESFAIPLTRWLSRVPELASKLEPLPSSTGQDKAAVVTSLPPQIHPVEIPRSQTEQVSIAMGQATAMGPDLRTLILTSEYQAELEQARQLLLQHKPSTARDQLELLHNRIWHDAAPSVRFRLLLLLGTSYLRVGEQATAGRLFVEAFQYGQDDQAFSLRALGHLLQDQEADAREYSTLAIEKNSGNTEAWGVLLRSSSEPWAELVARLPSGLADEPEVSLAVGIRILDEDNLEAATEWLRKSDSKQDWSPETGILLGQTLLGRITQDIERPVTESGPSDQIVNLAREAVLVYDRLLANFPELTTEMKVICLVNRAFARSILGERDRAVLDVENALTLDPESEPARRNCALLAFEEDRIDRAASLLRGIAQPTSVSLLLLGRVYVALGELEKAREAVLSAALANDVNQRILSILVAQIVEELASVCPEDAEAFIRDLQATHCSGTLIQLQEAKLQRLLGHPKAGIELLKAALPDAECAQLRLQIADEFFDSGSFADAARIYEEFASDINRSLVAPRLIVAHYRAGTHNRALELCRARNWGGDEYRQIVEIHSAICEDTGEVEEAEKVCREYLGFHPQDIVIQARLGLILHRRRRFEEISEIITVPEHISDGPTSTLIVLAQLLAETGRELQGLDLLYELRRTRFLEPEVHQAYIQLITKLQSHDEVLLPSTIASGCAVELRSQNRNKLYVIDDRPDLRLEQGEIPSHHSIGKALLGLKVGERLVLNQGFARPTTAEVVSIKSKYVHALHESMDRYEELFPEDPGVWMIPVNPDDPEGQFTELFAALDRLHEGEKEINAAYCEGKLPIGAVSIIRGRNIIETFSGLSGDSKLGIKCAIGNRDETREGLRVASQDRTPILDLTALLSLFSIKLSDRFLQVFAQPVIAPSTLDEINNAIAQIEPHRGKEGLTVGKTGDQYWRVVTSPEEIEQYYTQLVRIRDWVQEKCRVIPCTAALDLNAEGLKSLRSKIGRSFVDSALLANQLGGWLYSDDLLFRKLAAFEWEVEGAWTQAVLARITMVLQLSSQEHEDAVIRLVTGNYIFTRIAPRTLFEAAKASHWRNEGVFAKVLKTLEPESVEVLSAVRCLTGFFALMLGQPLPRFRMEHLVLDCVDTLLRKHPVRLTIMLMRGSIATRFLARSSEERFLMQLTEESLRMNRHRW